MNGRNSPKVKELRTMLLSWNRNSSMTAHPRTGVRSSPAERDAEVAIQHRVFQNEKTWAHYSRRLLGLPLAVSPLDLLNLAQPYGRFL